MNNLAFTFSTKKSFVGKHKYFGMIVHNNIEDAINRNIEYDIHSGWEDIDYVCMINERVRNEINRQVGNEWGDLSDGYKKELFKRKTCSSCNK